MPSTQSATCARAAVVVGLRFSRYLPSHPFAVCAGACISPCLCCCPVRTNGPVCWLWVPLRALLPRRTAAETGARRVGLAVAVAVHRVIHPQAGAMAERHVQEHAPGQHAADPARGRRGRSAEAASDRHVVADAAGAGPPPQHVGRPAAGHLGPGQRVRCRRVACPSLACTHTQAHTHAYSFTQALTNSHAHMHTHTHAFIGALAPTREHTGSKHRRVLVPPPPPFSAVCDVPHRGRAATPLLASPSMR